MAADLAGRFQHAIGQTARLFGGVARAGDVARDIGGAGGGLLDVARDLARRRALLLDGSGDRRGDLADLADRRAYAADGADAIAGSRLDGRDLAGDLLRRLGGLVGEVLDLAGDDGKTLAGIAGARRLDRRVEGKQVGLSRDRADQAEDLADFLRCLGQAGDGLRRLLGLGHRVVGDGGRMGDLATDLVDR